MPNRFDYGGKIWDLSQFPTYSIEYDIKDDTLRIRKKGNSRWFNITTKTSSKIIEEMTTDPESIQITQEEIDMEENIIKNKKKDIKNRIKKAEKLLNSKNGKKINKKDMTAIIDATRYTKDKYSFKFTKNGQDYYLNTNIPILKKLIENDFVLDEGNYGEGSDPEYLANFVNYGNPTLIKIKHKSDNNRKRDMSTKDKDGAYFNYTNNTNIDLKRYQIYSIGDKEDKTHCFIHSLKMTKQFKKSKLLSLTRDLPNTALQTNNIEKICDIIEKSIEVSHINSQNRVRKTIYGKKYSSDKDIKLALYKSHYFINEKTKYTKYYSKNYIKINKMVEDGLINRKNLTTITKINTVNNKKIVKRLAHKPISSLNLINNLFKSELFDQKAIDRNSHTDVKIEDSYFEDYSGENIESEQHLFSYEIRPKAINTKIFFADTETDTSLNHKLFLSGIINEDDDKTHISRNFEDTLEYVVEKTNPKDNVLIYYHNLKYDKHIIDSLIDIKKSVEKDTSVYSFQSFYKDRFITFRDSYKLIPVALSKFTKMFSLPYCKKEAIAYKYYKTSMEDHKVSIDKYCKNFETNINDNRNNLIESLRNNKKEFEYDELDKTFNPIKYYKHYLHYDCLLLREGIKEFNNSVMEITNNRLNIFNNRINTAASLGHNFAIMNGCYDGVYEIHRNLRNYVSKAVYGGRVNVNEKYSKKVIKGKIADYDGVSLYPSAMKRLCDEYGIPLGKAKYFKNTIPKSDYYITTIEISKINIKQDNPFISVREKTKNGIKLDYINSIPEGQTKKVTIDRYTLEDWVKFHGIEYKVLYGVYWNEGFNKNLGESITDLFNSRIQYKKDKKEALQQTVKLIMNSTYGKTITKKCNKKIIYKKVGIEGYNYIVKNWNTIKEFYSNGRHYRITMSKIDKSSNMGHIGCSILSMSKRIMNEVMDCASSNNLHIYYQDTDSMHIDTNNVPILEKCYLEKYGKVLNGKAMGQFHIDFSMGKNIIPSSINSCKSIFLGRKAYIDVLEGTDRLTGNKEYDLHIRMKGINSISIKNEADKNYEGDCFKMFEELSKGKEIEMILNPKGSVSFDFKNGNVMTKETGSFKRKIKF